MHGGKESDESKLFAKLVGDLSAQCVLMQLHVLKGNLTLFIFPLHQNNVILLNAQGCDIMVKHWTFCSSMCWHCHGTSFVAMVVHLLYDHTIIMSTAITDQYCALL